jgi:hypothetical protein
VFLIVQRCAVWMFLACGLAGKSLLNDRTEQAMVLLIMLIFAIYILGHYAIHILERYISYAGR